MVGTRQGNFSFQLIILSLPETDLKMGFPKMRKIGEVFLSPVWYTTNDYW